MRSAQLMWRASVGRPLWRAVLMSSVPTPAACGLEEEVPPASR